VHVTTTKAVRVSLLPDAVRREAFAEASRFRGEFYECLTARRDELFELVDAVLCADGAVKSPVDLTLLPEHRRGHGVMYGGLNHGRIDAGRLRTVLAGLSLPRFDDGRLVLAVDVSPWLRSDAPCSADRLFCHVYGRAKTASQFIPGWPYSFVAVLEPGATSWTAILDAVRLRPADDATAVTAAQLRGVVERLEKHPVGVPMRPVVVMDGVLGLYDVAGDPQATGPVPHQATFALSATGTSGRCPPSICPPFGGTASAGQGDPEPWFRREGAANVPGQITSSRNSRGPVSLGYRPRPELMAVHELELDALAQTGEQRRPVSGKDRLNKELVLVDQSQICQRQGERHATHPQALA
jgi:hypothetical protein